MRRGVSTREKRAALALSIGLTAAMFGLLLLASVSAIVPSPAAQVLVAFDTRTIDPEPAPQAEVPVPERVAAAIPAGGAPEDAPAPRPLAAPPAPVPMPVAAIDLAPRALPIETLAVPLATIPLADAGDVSQAVGTGDGGSGTGEGGASGSGEGGTRKLFASWAPSMDFSRDNRFYPQAARDARVEGVAWLRCLVIRGDRVRNCTLLGEKPQGYGFGAAALKTVPGLRLRLHDEQGQRVYDDWAVVTSTFTLDALRELRQAQRDSEAAEPALLP